MATLDEIFYSEFIKSMQTRRANTNLNLRELPLHKSEPVKKPTKNMAAVRGIQEEYYSKLNYAVSKEVVTLIGKRQLSKKIYLPDGSPRLNEDGEQKTEDIHVPLGCASIISSTKIGVPRSFIPKEQLAYVDFIEKDRVKKYIYIIPKKYLYVINMCALVLSVNKLRSYYTGIKVTLVNGHDVYIHVVPYHPTHNNENRPYYIIDVKPSANFDKEIAELLQVWEIYNIMFRRSLTAFNVPIKGVSNCGVFHFNSTLDTYELFNSEKSLEGVEEEY